MVHKKSGEILEICRCDGGVGGISRSHGSGGVDLPWLLSGWLCDVGLFASAPSVATLLAIVAYGLPPVAAFTSRRNGSIRSILLKGGDRSWIEDESRRQGCGGGSREERRFGRVRLKGKNLLRSH